MGYDTSDFVRFAEKIGNGIVDVGREVADKAKQVGDTAGLKFKLLEKERELEKEFFQLGVEYFQKHNEDQMCEYSQVEKIKLLQEEIRGIRDEIAVYKGKGVCIRCGEFVDSNAKFCPHCGERLE